MTRLSPISTISCIGLGLIGMSLLRALKQSSRAQGYSIFFQGYDPNFTDNDRRCVEELGLDSFTDDKKTLYSADLLILAAPVEVNIALLDEIREIAPSSTLVSDVSSTKSLIARKARELDLPFLGMHPMAGKEQNGYRASHEELLHGRPMIICDDRGLQQSEKGIFLVTLLESAGCKILSMTPDEHDEIIARISHLPQLLSTLLIGYCKDSLNVAGPGFATFARLAGSPWAIWRDIITTNSNNIADELDFFSAELALLSREVRQLTLQQLELRFSEANRLYQTFNEIKHS